MKRELEETGEMGAEEKNDSDDELREEKEEGSVCCAQHPFVPAHIVSIWRIEQVKRRFLGAR